MTTKQDALDPFHNGLPPEYNEVAVFYLASCFIEALGHPGAFFLFSQIYADF
jgi:hypothetical protein